MMGWRVHWGPSRLGWSGGRGYLRVRPRVRHWRLFSIRSPHPLGRQVLVSLRVNQRNRSTLCQWPVLYGRGCSVHRVSRRTVQQRPCHEHLHIMRGRLRHVGGQYPLCCLPPGYLQHGSCVRYLCHVYVLQLLASHQFAPWQRHSLRCCVPTLSHTRC